MGDPANIIPGNDGGVTAACAHLQVGGLVAFPTETVYGLGADARDDQAVARIFEAKNRPSFNPLIVHVLDFDAASAFGVLDTRARLLADTFWPGPLSLVVPRRPDCELSLLVSAGLDTIALRAPAHPLAHDLLARFGGPIAAPSANTAGEVSPTQASHVEQSLGTKADMILDGGACEVGLESTVIDLCGYRPALLRHGAITHEQLEEVLGPVDDATRPTNGEAPRSPGQLARHYAPAIPVRLDAQNVASDEGLLSFGNISFEGAGTALNLSPTGDLTEAAANLFAYMRQLDTLAHRAIAVVPIPDTGLGRAINDRLRRAAEAHNG
ncbi:MAG: L-threonylcarbamoyladenylate synthase [Alphaproteobacteria bacterium]|nr:L-threonylcarbamoyladenylate synthase [Alphaproteobacteria bacterium]